MLKIFQIYSKTSPESFSGPKHGNRGSVPVTFYSDFMPFVGAGIPLDSWPFTMELSRATEKDDQPQPLAEELVSALYEGVKSEVHRLGEGEQSPENAYRGLEVNDCVFVSAVRNDRPKKLLENILISSDGAEEKQETPQLSPEWVQGLIRASHERARHFLEISLNMWECQIVVTIFVRLTVQGGSLRLEGETYVMPPIARRYRMIDGIVGSLDELDSWENVTKAALANIGSDIPSSVSEFVEWWRSQSRTKKNKDNYETDIEAGEIAIDHGPRLSIRELGSESRYEQLFQSHDVRRFNSAVKERVLKALIPVLKEADYETSDLEGVVQHINQGFQYFGGSHVFSGPMAAGEGAGAIQVPKPKLG
ncbi:hypothetical protein GCM10022402_41840 [Salinactinospora qingdaonensis]|uniref:Uncharacterized protein n=2 Tax=Salinactinospora qingdaonensis TaxID=702744 RepID=A0ABP7G927_9ACTN